MGSILPHRLFISFVIKLFKLQTISDFHAEEYFYNSREEKIFSLLAYIIFAIFVHSFHIALVYVQNRVNVFH